MHSRKEEDGGVGDGEVRGAGRGHGWVSDAWVGGGFRVLFEWALGQILPCGLNIGSSGNRNKNRNRTDDFGS